MHTKSLGRLRAAAYPRAVRPPHVSFDDGSWPEALATALRRLSDRKPVQLVCPPWLESKLVGDVLDLGRGFERVVVDGYPSADWHEAAEELAVTYYPVGGQRAGGGTWSLPDVIENLLKRPRFGLVVLRGNGHEVEEQLQRLSGSSALVYVGIKPIGGHWAEGPQIVEYDPPEPPAHPLGPRSRPSGLSR